MEKTTMGISVEQLKLYVKRREKRFYQSKQRSSKPLCKICLSQLNRAPSEPQITQTYCVTDNIHKYYFDSLAYVTLFLLFQKYENPPSLSTLHTEWRFKSQNTVEIHWKVVVKEITVRKEVFLTTEVYELPPRIAKNKLLDAISVIESMCRCVIEKLHESTCQV